MNRARLRTSLAVVVLGTVWLPAPPLRAEEPILTIDSGGHTAIVRTVFFTPDGRNLVSAGEDKVIRVWDVAIGETVRTIRGQVGSGNEGKIYAAAISPGGETLAVGGLSAGSEPGVVRLIDFQSGQVIGTLLGSKNVISSLAFSPDGRFLAAGSGDTIVRIWEVATKRIFHTLSGHTQSINSVAFSPDGQRLVSGSLDHTLRLWDAATGKLVRLMEGSDGEVWAVAYSPDGRFIGSGGGGTAVLLWDAASGDFLRVLARKPNVFALAFSLDGQQLLMDARMGSVDIMSFSGGGITASFYPHDIDDFFPSATAFSPDGDLAATAGGRNQRIKVWNLGSGDLVWRLLGKGMPVLGVGFGFDGLSVVFEQDLRPESTNLPGRSGLGRALLLSRDDGRRITIEEAPLDLAIQAQNIAIQAHKVQLRSPPGSASDIDPVFQVVREGNVVREIRLDATSRYFDHSFALTPDGRSIVIGENDGNLLIYDASTGGLTRQLVGHTGSVLAVAVSPDGRLVVSGSSDQTLRLWDFASGKSLLTVFPASDGEWVAWTPEGYYTSSLHGDLYIGWQVNQGPDHAALYYPAAQFQAEYYRPDIVAEYLQTGDIQIALERANARRGMVAPAVSSIGSIYPPLVYVASPKDGAIVDLEELHVLAAALSANLPVTDLRILLNGVKISGVQEAPLKGNPREREVEFDVTLRSGANVLTFVAAHEKARSELVERHVTYRPPPGTTVSSGKPNLILLAIGISDYSDPSLKLSYAGDDAQAIATALGKQQPGRLFGEVRTRVLPAAGGRADRAEILDGLKWLRTQGTPRDVRILFLSGHGGLDDRRNFFFYSQDQGASEDLDLHSLRADRLLEDLIAARSPAILMIDACHAGAASAPARTRTDVTEVIKIFRERFQLVTFAASTGTELSVELPEWKHGAFTKALLEGLSGIADGFGGDKDGRIEVKELGAWVVDRVPKLTGGSQHALFDSGWVDASFPIFALDGVPP